MYGSREWTAFYSLRLIVVALTDVSIYPRKKTPLALLFQLVTSAKKVCLGNLFCDNCMYAKINLSNVFSKLKICASSKYSPYNKKLYSQNLFRTKAKKFLFKNIFNILSCHSQLRDFTKMAVETLKLSSDYIQSLPLNH